MSTTPVPPEPARHPIDELDDDDLFRELEHLYRTRLDTLRGGSQSALDNSDRRIGELEGAYLRRHPEREVTPRRLRPDDTSLLPGRRGRVAGG